MHNDFRLEFIKMKLQQIKSAVMYSTNSTLERLPNDIVEFDSIDEDGILWFTAHIPRQWMKAYELHFPVKLIFYKKGVDFFVEMSGTAVVVNKNGIISDTGNKLYDGTLLLKMTPYYIEYTEAKKRDIGFKKIKSQVYDYFMSTLGLNRAHHPHLTGQISTQKSLT
jgi:hypothetical protein